MQSFSEPEPRNAQPSPFEYWCTEHVRKTATVDRPSRGNDGATSFEAKEFAEADLLSIYFADGSLLHTGPAEFAARHANVTTTRNAAHTDSRRVVLPFSIATATTSTRGQDSSGEVSRYELARLTNPTTLDKLYDVGALFADGLDRWFGSNCKAPGMAVVAGKLCRAYESATLDAAIRQDNGVLLRWTDAGWQPAFVVQPSPRDIVLLLHGTASSTRGSFSGLWEGESDDKAAIPNDFRELARKFDLLAWEHRSLTTSPVVNALELLGVLQRYRAQGGRVHLLSHSRGGMVGELLALALRPSDIETTPETRSDLCQRVKKVFADCFGSGHPDRPIVDRLFKKMSDDVDLTAGIFVRVACPARGTLLADRRTDLFLSLLLRSVGLAFGTNGVPAWERLNGLVRSLVSARADARALPGLEAMIPGSALTLALNATDLPPIGGKLRVIAGDSRGLGWGGILSMLGDTFYGLHDHDFVVHTHSMFGGFTRRDPSLSLRLEDSSITHFAYFTAGAAARRAVLAVFDDREDGFRKLAEDEARTRGLTQFFAREPLSRKPIAEWLEALKDPALSDKPVLVVLPGIMGSELSEKNHAKRLVWMAMTALASGSLAQLNTELDDPLGASGLIPVAYERLLRHAGRSFSVVPVAYDWRQSIFESGRRLYEILRDIEICLGERRVPIHLIAHSMGGLVARAALFGADEVGAPDASHIKGGNALWNRLRQRGGRLLMLGTPNTGSYAPVQLLTQQHRLSTLLASVSRSVSQELLAQWGSKFTGLLQMLPAAPDPAFGSLYGSDAWRSLRQADARTHPPEDKTLQDAAAFRKVLDDSFSDLKAQADVLYVAGSGFTPTSLVDPKGRWQVPMGEGSSVLREPLGFKYTYEGDGTVPWLSTLDPARTWYAHCEHGSLADHEEAFPAYFDLLATGRTNALSQQPPRRRGTDEGNVFVPPTMLPSLPADPAAYVLGITQSSGATHAPEPVEVSIVHGSLDYARYPLIVGYYQNDHIMGAVQRVDEKLDGQLERLTRLKLFVGGSLTGAYLRPPVTNGCAPAYPGAIVVGLGTIGELTPTLLADSVTRNVLRYAFEHLNRDPWIEPTGPVRLRLSTVLIGTHVQAVLPRDSLAGVLQGVWRANHLLAQDESLGRSVAVAEVEVIEIQESVALDAAYELRKLMARDEWRDRFRWEEQVLQTRDGGLRGYRRSKGDAVWQRLVVRHEATGGLKFELIGERARVESTSVYADVASLSNYIARMSDEGAVGRSTDEDQKAFGVVLYQLLLPQALKGRLANFDNTVLVVDDKSAAYPWELLTPADDGMPGDHARPLAVQAGMVRQRVTSEFRSLPQSSDNWNALVVGAPSTEGWTNEKGEPLSFRPLPGAEQEASAVSAMLSADGRPWTPTLLLGKETFERVRTAFLERSYRLVHMAGHGVVDQWVTNMGEAPYAQPVRKTGMLLSHQQVLSASDVEQMDRVPEFVFINCCYSGRDQTEAKLLGQRHYPKLAASLAMQFIAMGAKAVIAAGWQVDDDDGLTFARTFYREMLGGARFGDAIRTARSAIRPEEGRRASNTWGAYQCYGDPEWSLSHHAASREGSGTYKGTSRLKDVHLCMSHYELAERIQQVVAVAGDRSAAPVLAQLNELRQRLLADPWRRKWLRSSLVRAAFGEAFRELGDHVRAVEWLQRSASTAYSRVQLRQMELMANSMSRLGTAAGHKVAHDIIDALGRLESVQPKPPPGAAAGEELSASAASERECLQGSNLMREAMTTSDVKQRAELLTKATGFFMHGYADKAERDDYTDRRAYALSSGLACGAMALLLDADKGVVLGLIDHADSARQFASNWRERARQLLEELAAKTVTASFWQYTNHFELLLAVNLLRAALGEKPSQEELDRVLLLLSQAMVRWPSPNELDSTHSRFAAVECVCEGLAVSGKLTPHLQPVRASITAALAVLKRE